MALIESVTISVFEVPCDHPESDGTIQWNATTMILVTLRAGNEIGMGYSYGHAAAAQIIKDKLAPLLKNANPFDIPLLWEQMVRQVRNEGLTGICAHAISAIDIALWDLKAKLLDLPLCLLFGMARDKVPVYGSGGFTSYTDKQTADQFLDWQSKGINKFKMKVGRAPDHDLQRVQSARAAIGSSAELFVDANGAYNVKQALQLAEQFADYGVSWFEEPVSSDNLEGLHFLREHLCMMDVAAGEYGYDSFYFKDMLLAKSVDVLQIDATRCCGYTGFLQAAHLGHAFSTPLSSHTAPHVHLPVCLSNPYVRHMEFFHDHVRIEELFFEGIPKLEQGCLVPHLNLHGHGLSLKKNQAKPYLIMEETL